MKSLQLRSRYHTRRFLDNQKAVANILVSYSGVYKYLHLPSIEADVCSYLLEIYTQLVMIKYFLNLSLGHLGLQVVKLTSVLFALNRRVLNFFAPSCSAKHPFYHRKLAAVHLPELFNRFTYLYDFVAQYEAFCVQLLS